MNRVVHICTFTSLDDIPKSRRTYENVKAAVLKAGRFSVWDCDDLKTARIFDRLARDPELEFRINDEKGRTLFPWTYVKPREVKA